MKGWHLNYEENMKFTPATDGIWATGKIPFMDLISYTIICCWNAQKREKNHL